MARTAGILLSRIRELGSWARSHTLEFVLCNGESLRHVSACRVPRKSTASGVSRTTDCRMAAQRKVDRRGDALAMLHIRRRVCACCKGALKSFRLPTTPDFTQLRPTISVEVLGRRRYLRGYGEGNSVNRASLVL